MIELKRIRPETIPAALEKAQRYRLLNESQEAESICLDILAVAPDNQEALITRLLALTDRFAAVGLSPAFENAREIVAILDSQYCKAYYTGIIYERRAKYHLRQGGPGCGTVAHEWFVKALECYKQALESCDPTNQDAVLRWNSCARILNSNPEIKPDDSDSAGMLTDAYENPI